jgi:glutamyl-tRNA synthetase
LGAYAGFYFVPSVSLGPEEAKEFTPEVRARLRKFRDALAGLDEFKAPKIEAALKAVATELGVKAGLLVHPTRLACTGSAAGPSLYHLLEVLSKESVIRRIDAALGEP